MEAKERSEVVSFTAGHGWESKGQKMERIKLGQVNLFFDKFVGEKVAIRKWE